LDPGRRDLLFGMHENSSVDNKQLHRYTSNQKSKETRSNKYRKLRTELKNDFNGALEAEAALSRCNRSTLDPDIYGKYPETRSRATLVLKSVYEKKESNHPNTEDFLFRKLRLSAYMNQKQADSRLASSLRNKFGEDAILVPGNSCFLIFIIYTEAEKTGFLEVISSLTSRFNKTDLFQQNAF
jgi:hypothetical protein